MCFNITTEASNLKRDEIMNTIYRLSSFHPAKHGFNEAPHKSMKALNKSRAELELKGFTKFIVDVYKTN
jgi:hypothetical protein